MCLSKFFSPQLDKHKNRGPAMKMEEYFNGPIDAWGVIHDWRGNVTRQFSIKLVGTWNGDDGTLEENFDFYDGEKQQRKWSIKKITDGQYEGAAGDIIGVAKGRTSGNAAQWQYKMQLNVNGKKITIDFDDWMFIMKDGVMINTPVLRKFGFKVASLTIFMQKKKA